MFSSSSVVRKAAALLTILVSIPYSSCLWPIPRSLRTGSTPVVLAKDFQIIAPTNAPADLDAAIVRSLSYIHNDKLQRLVVGRASADKSQVDRSKELPKLVLSLPRGVKATSIAEEATKPLNSRSEEYTLQVPADGSPATLSANSTLGLLRGLTTFEQLWYDLDGSATYTMEAPISIVDAPAFVSVSVDDLESRGLISTN